MRKVVKSHIFLIDGLGGLLSAAMLGLVLPRLEIGLPNFILTVLASIAVLYGVYSLSCHALKKSGVWLQAIAYANALYALITAGLLLYYFEQVSALGVAYFLGEILILAVLVKFEFNLSQQPAKI